MHDRLFEYQNHLDTKHLHAYARDLGLDMARFVAEMEDTIYLQRVREHIESGKQRRQSDADVLRQRRHL